VSNLKQKLNAILGIVLLGAALEASAVPTLTFDGTVNFDASSGVLSVDSILTSSSDIFPVPTTGLGSSLQFSATLDPGSISSFTDIFGNVSTVSDFGGVLGDDLTVMDASSNTLLIGEFIDLTMFGRNGQGNGVLTGNVSATGGSLQSDFGTSHILAVEFILTPSFSFGPDMFRSDFGGEIDGDLTSTAVPEPGIVAMLAMGLVLIGFVRPKHRHL
jgi:hypothetical protein